MAQATETAEITRSLTEEVAVTVLTSSVEGGSGYWAGVSDYQRDADLMYTSLDVYDREDLDAEGNPTEVHKVTTKDITAAIKKIAKGGVVNKDMTKRIAKLKGKNRENVEDGLCEMDAYDADAVLQVAAFGEVIFG